jgi:hypothetical protein
MTESRTQERRAGQSRREQDSGLGIEERNLGMSLSCSKIDEES